MKEKTLDDRFIQHALLGATLLLVSIGLLAIAAASPMKAIEVQNDAYYFLKKQALFVALGLFMIFVIKNLPSRWLEHAALPFALLNLGLLSLVFVPGVYHQVGGAQRWLRIAGVSLQISELGKLACLFFVARSIARPGFSFERRDLGLFALVAYPILVIGLLMRQPDFGTSLLVAILCLIFVFIGGISRRTLIPMASLALLAAIAAVYRAPYRLKRLMSFLDPWAARKEGGFQIIQSYLGFQNGGFWGVGLGASKQKLFFLPEAHTDFIFSVIGEELGLAGSLLVLSLFAFISYLAFLIAWGQKSPFRFLLAYGIACLFSVQALFNLGVVSGLLPTKGIPLPLISSGLSSLTLFFFLIAILLRLAANLDPGHGIPSLRR